MQQDLAEAGERIQELQEGMVAAHEVHSKQVSASVERLPRVFVQPKNGVLSATLTADGRHIMLQRGERTRGSPPPPPPPTHLTPTTHTHLA